MPEEQKKPTRRSTPRAKTEKAEAEVKPKYRLNLLGCLLISAVMLGFMAIVMATAIGVGVWFYVNRGTDSVSALKDQARAVLVESGKLDKNHALYFSRMFQGLGDRVALDKSGAFDTVSECGTLMAVTGSFAVNGAEGMNYPSMPEFIKKNVLEASFGAEGLDKDLSPEEQAKFADQLKAVGAAFDSIYKGK